MNKKLVSDLSDLGFPFAEVEESGDGFISKVNGTGGLINTATCIVHLFYEIHDPAHYLTPDCTADFSKVEFEAIAENCVRFSKATGKKATETYKVSVGYSNGYAGEGQISYGGHDCVARARIAAEIIKKRLEILPLQDLRLDIIGLNSITPIETEPKGLQEV